MVISNVDGRYALQEQSTPRNGKPNLGANTTISLTLRYSSLRVVRTGFGNAFVVLGRCSTNGTQYLGLADSAVWLVELPQSGVVSSLVTPQSEVLLLSVVVANLLLPALTGTLAEDDTVIVHKAPPIVATLLSRHAGAVEI